MKWYGYWCIAFFIAVLAELLARWLDIPKYFRPERPDGE